MVPTRVGKPDNITYSNMHCVLYSAVPIDTLQYIKLKFFLANNLQIDFVYVEPSGVCCSGENTIQYNAYNIIGS